MPREKDFTWTREADKAFEEMKRYIEKLPTLVALKVKESLIIYLTASRECVSEVLMTERGKDQRPVYFQVAEATTEEENNWMTPIVEYLISGILPADKETMRKIRVKAPNYQIIVGIFYKRSFPTPWLRCGGPKQARSVIEEIHEGSCGLHAGPRSIMAK
ncbi:reverse transcriptase domain-containing protein, partial [Tanacetum coccineum]